ncbi:PVC-type heme-binding CxxCH protein [Alienimonas sp. DA493]|uniref:PVC-type heme-binding CxxCH protein n=1 Tax=Alienimonas sp. DA493 TaxID=3373605 RepID=UPI0037541804
MLRFSPLALFACLLPAPLFAAELDPEPGDRIALVGNALAEGLQHHNEWEALLYQRFPDRELVVRNLAFPGDEPFLRIRTRDFGSPDDHLKHVGADVVLYFFGFNESFAGEAGLEDFKADMQKLVEETKTKDYSGDGPPRIVLVSPIAFENTGDPNLPDGSEHNARLEMYTDALRSVAETTGVGFVDLFRPTLKLFRETDERLTLNGAHLNEAGYEALAPILDAGLFGEGTPESPNPAVVAELNDKNFHWWHRYRAVNGYSIWGPRGLAGSDGTYNNRDVMNRELAILDQMTANRDERVWTLAGGGTVPDEVDDSNTLPFITPKSNVGGEDDPNRKRGKLGSLDYLSAEEQLKSFTLPPGYEIELVASEEQFPELANPVALNFDDAGRLWVAVMPSYPHWKPKTELNDKLLILEDDDGDGKTDRCVTYAGGLHQPTGFEFGMGGVFVAQQPDILFLKDNDGDDHVDVRREFTEGGQDVRIRKLSGFGTADSHHGIAAFEWGPGGNLYFQEGTFKMSQVEDPYGVDRLSEAGVWRYNPRTERTDVHISFAFANPWGHVFDDWGQEFLADASPGENYWGTPISGRIDWPEKHPGGSQGNRVVKEMNLDPNNPYPPFFKKRIRPTAGNELVSSRHFPDEVQGDYLITNVIGDRAVLQYDVEEDGSGFTATERDMLLVNGGDGNFRPVDLQFAPDGSLYIVDWHNALIGHLQHNLRDPNRDHSHGRIWRVTYPERPLVDAPQIEGAEIPALLDLLDAPEYRTRYRARRQLAARETAEVLPAVDEWLQGLDESDPNYVRSRLEGLWQYQTHNTLNEPLLKELLTADDHRARAAAVRVLSFWLDRVEEPLALLEERIADEHPRVRLEAVRALSFLDGPEAIELALGVLENDLDTFLQYTLDETMRALDE